MAKKEPVKFTLPSTGSTVHAPAELRDTILNPPGASGGSDMDAPGGNASTAEWRDYRLGNGYDAAELEGLSRDELRDLEDRS